MLRRLFGEVDFLVVTTIPSVCYLYIIDIMSTSTCSTSVMHYVSIKLIFVTEPR